MPSFSLDLIARRPKASTTHPTLPTTTGANQLHEVFFNVDHTAFSEGDFICHPYRCRSPPLKPEGTPKYLSLHSPPFQVPVGLTQLVVSFSTDIVYQNCHLGTYSLQLCILDLFIVLFLLSTPLFAETGLSRLRSLKKKMTVLKRYVLRLFMSLKYITANVVDRNNGRIIATASTVEHSIKNSLECGRSCNAKAAMVVGEVLAMRLRVEGLDQGQGRGIHVDVNKEVEKKGFKNRTKVWAIVNALKNNGVKLVLEDNVEGENPSDPTF
ncbi:hypothetical protein F8388_008634 [Cannabis sativa]|uniref:50S ribosomal protein L18 n=2 Tax=Cannabis sativa TaxID=3483 RepID=A0A7J6GH08_CANSA|nr:hypothetical protein F8388_008634 [Cannabis sativa]